MPLYWRKVVVLVFCALTVVIVSSDEICLPYIADDTKISGIRLQCPGSSVIFQPEVFAFEERNCDKSRCYGRTADMLVQLGQCYWNTTCEVQVPESRTLIVNGENCNVLTGPKPPRSMSFQRGLCVNNANIFDMCSRTIAGISSDSFILRSHAEYPWIYDRGIFIPKGKSIVPENNCSQVFQPRNTHRQLIVNITAFDIGEETDYLKIESGSQMFSISSTNFSQPIVIELQNPEPHPVWFWFGHNVAVDTSDDTKGGSGFVICVRAVSSRLSPDNLPNACSGLITNDLTAAKKYKDTSVTMTTPTPATTRKRNNTRKQKGNNGPKKSRRKGGRRNRKGNKRRKGRRKNRRKGRRKNRRKKNRSKRNKKKRSNNLTDPPTKRSTS